MPIRTNLSSEERREKTVEAVISLCAEDDPANITTSEIAKRMKVTQGALFRHFISKDAIWESVIGWVAERVMQRLDNAASEVESPLSKLQAMFLTHIEFIKKHPGVPRLLLGQLQHSRLTPARRMVQSLLGRYRERVVQQLADAKVSGELRRDLDIEVAATQYIGMIQGLVVQSLLIGDMDYLARQAPSVFELFCHGICAEAGT
ncbi:TetR family transcriptional regulator [Arsukibacterium ikkense]|uniref:TetR family transcriptional regulator n=1 Tax=Arsukibacterium ikkense TaxID=336831 RepID=A0A0M2V0K3_9GAMM|nr:TetR family transcriptional regulator [Arsukibacterium ikkense]